MGKTYVGQMGGTFLKKGTKNIAAPLEITATLPDLSNT
jgi:hypothetical protein